VGTIEAALTEIVVEGITLRIGPAVPAARLQEILRVVRST